MKYCNKTQFAITSISCLFPVAHISAPHENKLTPEIIIRMVCDKFYIHTKAIKLKTRVTEICVPRQLACLLIHEHFPKHSDKRIAHLLGLTNHATIINAYAKTKKRIEADWQIKSKYHQIINDIKINFATVGSN